MTIDNKSRTKACIPAQFYCLLEMLRLLCILDDLRDRLKNPDGYRSQETEDAEDVFLKQRHRAMGVAGLLPDPTALLVIDEADRLKMAGLEQTRSIF